MNIPVVDVRESASWGVDVGAPSSKVAMETVAGSSLGKTDISVSTVPDSGELVGVMWEDEIPIDEPKSLDMTDMTS
ncbi:MAG: hypothetical protein IKZ36_04515, partial [Kiritimatiellae bacterium]|nr:hypothetical protein [Kiritimatiellia bacterium]